MNASLHTFTESFLFLLLPAERLCQTPQKTQKHTSSLPLPHSPFKIFSDSALFNTRIRNQDMSGYSRWRSWDQTPLLEHVKWDMKGRSLKVPSRDQLETWKWLSMKEEERLITITVCEKKKGWNKDMNVNSQEQEFKPALFLIFNSSKHFTIQKKWPFIITQ